MDWSRPIDLYCERTDPSFWAEPVNAISNAAFLIVAIAAFAQWRRAGTRDIPVLLLILLIAVIGIGSFIFHTVATSGAELADTSPIALFIYAYLALALRRFLKFGWALVAFSLGLFALVSYGEAASVPPGALNGSHAYLPALVVLLLVGLAAWRQETGRLLIGAGAVFALSILFRSLDNALCPVLPLGTHFLWHGLNAVVLYLLLSAAMWKDDLGRDHGPP
jgi:hypothetical protein